MAAASRLDGYVLLSGEPVSLGRITADLEVTLSSASVAARLLAMYALARRHGERSSRRVLYEASDNYAGMLTEQHRWLRALAERLRGGARGAASGWARDRVGRGSLRQATCLFDHATTGPVDQARLPCRTPRTRIRVERRHPFGS